MRSANLYSADQDAHMHDTNTEIDAHAAGAARTHMHADDVYMHASDVYMHESGPRDRNTLANNNHNNNNHNNNNHDNNNHDNNNNNHDNNNHDNNNNNNNNNQDTCINKSQECICTSFQHLPQNTQAQLSTACMHVFRLRHQLKVLHKANMHAQTDLVRDLMVKYSEDRGGVTGVYGSGFGEEGVVRERVLRGLLRRDTRMHVCMRVCMCVFVCVCVRVCMYICVYVTMQGACVAGFVA
jgi:hypothetical protein